ncbi:MAG: ClbS/DfsB family four-helix bundle protein [Planctomycetota bacterium]
MPRPTNKIELLSASRERYSNLVTRVDSFSRKQLYETFPFEHRDRTVRDVLAHLHHWQVMMLEWYEIGMSGGMPDMPAKGYTWKTTNELNAAIWKKYQRTSLPKVRKKLDESHNSLLGLVDGLKDEELFTKRRYRWTGSTSLGSYFNSALPSHYDWAIKLLKRVSRATQDR